MTGEPGERRDRSGDYRAARIGAAGALTAALFIMLVADTMIPTYDPSPITIALLLGALGGLLGVEIANSIGRK
jgi:hypothetical protein